MARFCERCGKLSAEPMCPACAATNHTPSAEVERRQRRVLKRLIRQGLVPKKLLHEVFR